MTCERVISMDVIYSRLSNRRRGGHRTTILFSCFCRRHTVSLSAPPAPPIAIKRLGSASTRFMQHALKPACRIDIGAPAKCAAQSCPIIRRIIRNTPYNTGFGATVSYLYAVLYGVLYPNPKIRRIIRESKAPYRIFRIVLGNSGFGARAKLQSYDNG